MKFLWSAAVVFLVACSGSSPVAVDVEPTPGLEGFEARLDEIRVQLQIPGLSAAIVKDGAVAWSKGLGYADVNKSRPATPSTSFHLASLTKTFAVVILLQLVEEGRLDLQTPVSTWNVDLPGAEAIEVRHLMSHTSEGVPGAAFLYNGNRFGELDKVIEGVSGRTFAELIVERILGPLGLRHTAPNVEDAESFRHAGLDRRAFIANMATGYARKDRKVFEKNYPSLFNTAGGLIGSVEDVAAWSMAIDAGLFLSASTWDQIFTPTLAANGQPLPYGMGWYIHEHEGIGIQWHHGWWVANSSLIIRVPERGLSFVAAANTDAMSSHYNLGGDSNLLRSDIARLFIETFVLQDTPVPE